MRKKFFIYSLLFLVHLLLLNYVHADCSFAGQNISSNSSRVISGKTVYCDNVGGVWTSPLVCNYTWTSAKSYCSNLTYGGQRGWVLPSSHTNCCNSSSCTSASGGYIFWTSVKNPWSTGWNENTGAFDIAFITFMSGCYTSSSSEHNGYCVMCTMPLTGKCGSSQGKIFTVAPSTNLCDSGAATTVSGTGPWTWSCLGANGGGNASCSAAKPIDGVCGTANDSSFESKPTSNLCSAGIASTVTGIGPWLWTCSSSGGKTATCNAYLKGVCGIAKDKSTYSIPTTDLCSIGSASNVVVSDDTYVWSCSGSNSTINTDDSVCAAPRKKDGACGTANGGSSVDNPNNNLCAVGTSSIVTSNEDNFNWTCSGVNGGSSTSCSSFKIPPACGVADGQSFISAPTDNLCTHGAPGKPDWFNSEYTKRKAINITNSSGGLLSNYQVRLNVAYDADMKSDCIDVRFTDLSGSNLLNYWIESKTNSSSAIAWVKVPSIPTSGITIYMYYGNSVVSSGSNGDNTFILFDDFNGESINTAKWVKVDNSGNVVQTGGTLRLNNGPVNWGNTGLYSVANLPRSSMVIEGKYMNNCTAGAYYRDTTMLWMKNTSNSIDYPQFTNAFYAVWHNNSYYWTVYESGTHIPGTGALACNTQYRIRQIVKPAGGAITQLSSNNGASWVTVRDSSYYAGLIKVGITHYDGGVVFIDDLIVRNYVYLEPTAVFGTEESNSMILTGSGPWEWYCVGGGTSSPKCTANQLFPLCGSADGQSFINPPISGLCSYGDFRKIDWSGGSGKDGNIDLSPSSVTIYNINTVANWPSIATAPGVNFRVTENRNAGTSQVVIDSATGSGLALGDEILIINLQGTTSNNSNVGNYEFAMIKAINSNTPSGKTTLTLGKTLANRYDGTTQKIMVQRVPNWNNVTVGSNATITANAFSGNLGGIVVFRSSGILTMNGIVNMNGKGFRGSVIDGRGACGYPWPTVAGDRGESYAGTNSVVPKSRCASVVGNRVALTSIAGGGGGGAASSTSTARGGGGGGAGSYGTAGTAGTASTYSEPGGVAGSAYGTASLSKVYLGSAGGQSGTSVNRGNTAGGNGGGIVMIYGNQIINTGTITAKGSNGGAGGTTGSDDCWGGGGGGSGGSILIQGEGLTLGNKIYANGGTGGTGGLNGWGRRCGSGGSGGNGIIAFKYISMTSGSSTPSSNNAIITNSALSGSGPWQWYCKADGFISSMCETNNNPGVCGLADDSNRTSAPTTDLCSSGSASTVTGSGPWNWTCTSGSSTASCSANKIIDGQCGTAAKPYSFTDTAYTGSFCSQGNPPVVNPSFPNPGATATWTCGGIYDGSNISCSATRASNPITAQDFKMPKDFVALGETDEVKTQCLWCEYYADSSDNILSGKEGNNLSFGFTYVDSDATASLTKYEYVITADPVVGNNPAAASNKIHYIANITEGIVRSGTPLTIPGVSMTLTGSINNTQKLIPYDGKIYYLWIRLTNNKGLESSWIRSDKFFETSTHKWPKAKLVSEPIDNQHSRLCSTAINQTDPCLSACWKGTQSFNFANPSLQLQSSDWKCSVCFNSSGQAILCQNSSSGRESNFEWQVSDQQSTPIIPVINPNSIPSWWRYGAGTQNNNRVHNPVVQFPSIPTNQAKARLMIYGSGCPIQAGINARSIRPIWIER